MKGNFWQLSERGDKVIQSKALVGWQSMECSNTWRQAVNYTDEFQLEYYTLSEQKAIGQLMQYDPAQTTPWIMYSGTFSLYQDLRIFVVCSEYVIIVAYCLGLIFRLGALRNENKTPTKISCYTLVSLLMLCFVCVWTIFVKKWVHVCNYTQNILSTLLLLLIKDG